MTFLEYLQDYFVKNTSYHKDEIEDRFDAWISQLDVDEVIKHAEKWHDKEAEEIERYLSRRG